MRKLPSNVQVSNSIGTSYYRRLGESYNFAKHRTFGLKPNVKNKYYKWDFCCSDHPLLGEWVSISEQEFNILIYGKETFKLI